MMAPSTRATKKQAALAISIHTRACGLLNQPTMPAPTVAETIGGTTARPHTVVGVLGSTTSRRAGTATAVARPMTVPMAHRTRSARQAASLRPEEIAGSTADVADPTARTPIDTIPHCAIATGFATLARKAARSRAMRATNDTVRTTSRVQAMSQKPTASVWPNGMTSVRSSLNVPRIALPMTLPYQAGDAAGTVGFSKNEPVVR